MPGRKLQFDLLSLSFVLCLAACGNGQPHVAAIQPNAGVTRVVNDDPHCFTPIGALNDVNRRLFTAAGEGTLAAIASALASGADIQATDLLKRTALFAAAFCNRADAADTLIRAGAKIDVKDANGMSPLHVTAIMNASSVATALLANGADINIRSASGRTPLFYAAATDGAGMVQLFLAHGAAEKLRDKDGRTALSIAMENGHQGIALMLKYARTGGQGLSTGRG